MTTRINVMISTADAGVNKLKDLIKDKRDTVSYIVGHQITDVENAFDLPEVFLNRQDVFYYKSYDKGISKNRNLTISKADGDIGVIADDDVSYFDNSFDVIDNSYVQNPKADVIVFQIEALNSNKSFKNYDENQKWLKLKDAERISSIEITFRICKIKEYNIDFSTNFGLGSSLTGGEENLFIYECIKKGLNVLYIPIKIVRHPLETSGKNPKTVFSLKGVKSRGANMFIHYRKTYLLYYIYFLVKHYRIYSNNISFLECVNALIEGKKLTKNELEERRLL